MASAKAKVAGAGAILGLVSSRTQMKSRMHALDLHHVDVVKEDSVWEGKAKQMYEGKPVSPFDFLEFLYPMAHLPPDLSPVTEMLAKSREDADFAKFLPSTLAVSAILEKVSETGLGLR